MFFGKDFAAFIRHQYLDRSVLIHLRCCAVLCLFVGVEKTKKMRMFGVERQVNQTKATLWQCDIVIMVIPLQSHVLFFLQQLNWQWNYVEKRHRRLCCQCHACSSDQSKWKKTPAPSSFDKFMLYTMFGLKSYRRYKCVTQTSRQVRWKEMSHGRKSQMGGMGMEWVWCFGGVHISLNH